MNRILAVLLIVLGVAGLILGRLGETVWAPAQERTATVELSDPGPAVVIDPGVLYVGGHEGTVTVKGAKDVSVITASSSDLKAYLEGTEYTDITGVPSWDTLSVQKRHADDPAKLKDPTSSDLWRSVDTQGTTATIDIADFWAGESGKNQRPFRPILLVTDGSHAGAQEVTITWPVEAKNEWVPYAYAAGAAVAVIGLVLLVVAPRRRRDDEETIAEDESIADDETGAEDETPEASETSESTTDEDGPATTEERPHRAGSEDETVELDRTEVDEEIRAGQDPTPDEQSEDQEDHR